MSSGLPLKADIAQYSRHVSRVPGADMKSTKAIFSHRRVDEIFPTNRALEAARRPPV
jgi:hypothetical protein